MLTIFKKRKKYSTPNDLISFLLPYENHQNKLRYFRIDLLEGSKAELFI
jgi:hypothetical protein